MKQGDTVMHHCIIRSCAYIYFLSHAMHSLFLDAIKRNDSCLLTNTRRGEGYGKKRFNPLGPSDYRMSVISIWEVCPSGCDSISRGVGIADNIAAHCHHLDRASWECYLVRRDLKQIIQSILSTTHPCAGAVIAQLWARVLHGGRLGPRDHEHPTNMSAWHHCRLQTQEGSFCYWYI